MSRQEVALRAFLAELRKDYERWYVRATRRSYRWYIALQVTILATSFAAAVVAAIADRNNFSSWMRTALIVLPLLGALASSILTQAKLYDQWRLREDGRLKFQELVSEGRQRLASTEDSALLSAAHRELHERAQRIEREQADGFFAFFTSGSTATFQNPPTPGNRLPNQGQP